MSSRLAHASILLSFIALASGPCFGATGQSETNIRAVPITELMTRNPRTIAPDKLAAEAVQLMERYKVNQILVVTEIAHPNTDRKRKAYRDQVVAGVAASTPGYRLLDRRDGEPSSSWTIDLTFERTVAGATEVVAMRLYLVPDRTLVLAIATPAAGWRAAKVATHKLVRGFRYRPQ